MLGNLLGSMERLPTMVTAAAADDWLLGETWTAALASSGLFGVSARSDATLELGLGRHRRGHPVYMGRRRLAAQDNGAGRNEHGLLWRQSVRVGYELGKTMLTRGPEAAVTQGVGEPGCQ